MATPELVTQRDFTNSRYAQLAESSDNLNMNDVLASAEAVIQTKLGRRISMTEYVDVARNVQGNTIFVQKRPLSTVSQVRKRFRTPNAGWITISPYNYTYETGPGYVEVFFDSVQGLDVEITYEAGYTELPLDLKEAILLQAVLLSVQDFETYGTGDSRSPGYVGYMTAQIDGWLDPYRATATVYH